tara:strand:- start:444 stop:1205 length:762 start_codon:yes stop_codon:yes gene_type:complete
MKITDKNIEPSPSSTVLLVRQGKAELEVLMMLRKKNTSFGSSYVFPGGVLEKADTKEEEALSLKEQNLFNEKLNLETGGFAYFSAAIRELFEEAGILLALDKKGDFPDYLDINDYRKKLNSGELNWNEFLRQTELTMNHERLVYFSFWITPLRLTHRFTTRFFITEMPANQFANHCGHELIDTKWMSPRDALIMRRKKEINIPHPTAITLMQIREFKYTQDVMQWGSKKSDQGIPCYFPELTAAEIRGDASLE